MQELFEMILGVTGNGIDYRLLAAIDDISLDFWGTLCSNERVRFELLNHCGPEARIGGHESRQGRADFGAVPSGRHAETMAGDEKT